MEGLVAGLACRPSYCGRGRLLVPIDLDLIQTSPGRSAPVGEEVRDERERIHRARCSMGLLFNHVRGGDLGILGNCRIGTPATN